MTMRPICASFVINKTKNETNSKQKTVTHLPGRLTPIASVEVHAEKKWSIQSDLEIFVPWIKTEKKSAQDHESRMQRRQIIQGISRRVDSTMQPVPALSLPSKFPATRYVSTHS